MNNKSLKAMLLLVVFAASALMILSSVHYFELGKQLSGLQSRLSESRSNWESIAAEKDILQKELDEKQLALKKAEQSLEETTEKTEELKAEISVLKTEIDALRGAPAKQD